MSVALWRKHPNGGTLAALAVPREQTGLLLERGWVSLDGCRAQILGIEEHESLTGMDSLRIQFDEPFPWPHP